MYTYQEIRTTLINDISNLYTIEDKWIKCIKCPHSGRCCIGANVDIYDCEWGDNKVISFEQ